MSVDLRGRKRAVVNRHFVEFALEGGEAIAAAGEENGPGGFRWARGDHRVDFGIRASVEVHAHAASATAKG